MTGRRVGRQNDGWCSYSISSLLQLDSSVSASQHLNTTFHNSCNQYMYCVVNFFGMISVKCRPPAKCRPGVINVSHPAASDSTICYVEYYIYSSTSSRWSFVTEISFSASYTPCRLTYFVGIFRYASYMTIDYFTQDRHWTLHITHIY